MKTDEIKPGSELTESELGQINASLFREFKVPAAPRNDLKNKLFFLFKEEDEILAMGALMKVEPVYFNDEKFTLHGVVEIVANRKGEGYGMQVVTAMRDHLMKNDLIGLGFCMPKVQGFYEKCGFLIDTTSVQRFVYVKDGERITNQDGQLIFYQDSSARFMEKVLTNKDKEVSIPTKDLW
jgi:hypothetical protein